MESERVSRNLSPRYMCRLCRYFLRNSTDPAWPDRRKRRPAPISRILPGFHAIEMKCSTRLWFWRGQSVYTLTTKPLIKFQVILTTSDLTAEWRDALQKVGCRAVTFYANGCDVARHATSQAMIQLKLSYHVLTTTVAILLQHYKFKQCTVVHEYQRRKWRGSCLLIQLNH